MSVRPPRSELEASALSHPAEEELGRLEEQHLREEAEEAARTFVDAPRPLALSLPEGGRLPRSEAWLARLYAGERIVREKKPPVFDALRSVGPWMVSVDEPPLAVLDAMSQTATVCEGFAEDAVVQAYLEGRFGETLVAADDTTAGHWAAQAFAERLSALAPGFEHVSFVNSGAEACEKALALAKASSPPGRTRVLAFEGSFHGRTLLALHASFNPQKRAPFEFEGHEVIFAPFPEWPDPSAPEPPSPPDFLAAVAEGRLSELASPDPLFAAELSSLRAVDEALRRGDVFAVIVEPMQSEGGDRYATSRFFRALRLLTRHHAVPLVMDEVQTGFGLGGTFFWHRRFGLVDRAGFPDSPDFITLAKRAQVGVVLSKTADPEPTSAHTASLLRGLVHAEVMSEDSYAAVVEDEVRRRLEAMKAKYPRLVERPRVTGYALAFDLPSPELLNAYLEQRFYRGAIVFGAGHRTVRYRLSRGFGEREIELLFDAIDRSLAFLEARPGERPPPWEDLAPTAPSAETRALPELRVRRADASERDLLLPRILELEASVYEPARRDSPERLGLAFDDPDGVAVVAELREGEGWTLVGCALGAPLERFAEVAGPDRDAMLGRANTLYSIALTVAPDHHGLGLGRHLKHCQVEAAREVRRPDGSPRYEFISGRNRVGRTDAMMRINWTLGAIDLGRISGVYDDPEAEALYYRQPIGAPRPIREASAQKTRVFVPESLVRAEREGLLYGPAVNKLTLCNYVTPGVVRAVEWIASLAPELPHLYLTSSRDECFDKTVRLLKWHRKKGRVVLGLEGGYVGHTTAAARSLSDPAVHRQGSGYFRDWARLPHPEEVGEPAFERAIEEAIASSGGPDFVLGIVVEGLQERTGRMLSPEAFASLARVRAKFGVPIVLSESATATYRSGRGPFFVSGARFLPDVLFWWDGGQVGFLHVSGALFVRTPLTFVSTWDGDELSLVRTHHRLREARRIDVVAASERLDESLAPLVRAGVSVRGVGLSRVVHFAEPTRLAEVLRGEGVEALAFPHGAVSLRPRHDLGAEAYAGLGKALERIVR